MKRWLALLLSLIMLFASIPAYAEGPLTEEIDISSMTIYELSDIVEQDVETTIDSLFDEYDDLITTLNDFAAYQVNPSLTEEFYKKIMAETEALSIRLRKYAILYAEIIINDTTDYDDKYDDLDDIYDDLYEDAADEIYEVYDDLLDDMYEDIYDGIIDDAYDTVAYKVWDEARSAEYSLWDEARSEVYSTYDTVRSDIYHFYDNLRSHTYRRDNEKINKDIAKFQRLVDKLMGLEVEPLLTIDLSTLDLSTITTTEEMDIIIEADVDAMISSLSSEFDTLQSELDSYEKYKADSTRTEEFYDHVVEEVEKASGRLREYTLRYAEIIIDSDMGYRDQYDALSDITDAVYSGAGPTLNREIYSGILKKAQRYFYEKVLKTGFDIAPYSEVSSFRSDEYSNNSDARSDVYSEISDLRSDVYSFISDLRSAVYSKDTDKIEHKIERFRRDTEKFK